MTPEELQRYSELIVRGLHRVPPRRLAARACEPRSPRPRGRLAEAAYRAGAVGGRRRLRGRPRRRRADPVRVQRGARPPHLLAARKRCARSPTSASRPCRSWASTSSTWSPAFRPPASPTMRSAWRPMERWRESAREGRLRGTICAWPTVDWAARVFPGVDPGKPNGGSLGTCSGSAGSGPRDPEAFKGGRTSGDAARRATRSDAAGPYRVQRSRPRHRPARRIAPFSLLARRWRAGSLGA